MKDKALLILLAVALFVALLLLQGQGVAGDEYHSPISPLPLPVDPGRSPTPTDQPGGSGPAWLRCPPGGCEFVVVPQPTPGWLPPEGWRR